MTKQELDHWVVMLTQYLEPCYDNVHVGGRYLTSEGDSVTWYRLEIGHTMAADIVMLTCTFGNGYDTWRLVLHPIDENRHKTCQSECMIFHEDSTYVLKEIFRILVSPLREFMGQEGLQNIERIAWLDKLTGNILCSMMTRYIPDPVPKSIFKNVIDQLHHDLFITGFNQPYKANVDFCELYEEVMK